MKLVENNTFKNVMVGEPEHPVKTYTNRDKTSELHTACEAVSRQSWPKMDGLSNRQSLWVNGIMSYVVFNYIGLSARPNFSKSVWYNQKNLVYKLTQTMWIQSVLFNIYR